MKIPKQTGDIFKILSKGQFISSNSPNQTIQNLYSIIDQDDNFENLYEYFVHINFILEKGNEYFYFSRPEKIIDLEKKIEKAFEWIDILDFLKTFHNSFGAGFRFTPSEILAKIPTDADLEIKLKKFNTLKKNISKTTYSDILDRILKKLADDTFIEIENDINQQYKVLSSFAYLEQLILTINIPTKTEDEILK
ncbi:hypothetical protein Fleli_2100 [Bernardetia litoralis DSM 6794]|uniref:Uncharacterized protein n=1 Tax=Bernardetia litoralis (strain ATCC 23117 / DSM 6794 / NBRC 15988 / NCIMB 1366 / Fx l1 / Sio-4) TaxID=880071 RepID=I4AKJ8_BERLS|nr:hypothetical protein [Bernardetia litoralis]AFM04483.1 hypothetical protein Fleli_2100 [Bernardetia litoralis DSM 6794]